MLFRRLVWLALGIALVAGSLQWLVQQLQAVPIIQAAEQFEARKVESVPTAAQAHEHAAQAWEPKGGIERQAWTWIANVLWSFGLSLLTLVALGLWVRSRGTPTRPLIAGLATALAGFICFYLWPTLGLPAEVPGMDAAQLGSRQAWWLLAAGCAAVACAWIAFGRKPWRWVVAAGLLALPFVIGAPHIAGSPFDGFSVEAAAQVRALSQRFIWATAVVAVVQWLVLGLLCGLALERWLVPVISAAAPGGGTEPRGGSTSQVRG